MKTVSFFRLMLLLPLAVPLLLLPFGYHAVLGFLMLAAMFGGPQYLLFAGFVLIVSRKFDAQQLRKIILLAPLLFVPLQLLGVVLQYFFVPGSGYSASDIVGWCMFFFIYTIAIGYFYVALAWLLYWIFTTLNVVRD